MKLSYRIVTSLFWIYFKLFFHLKVNGLEHLPKGAAIITPNHASYLDPPLVAGILPEETGFLAKEALFRHPLLGPFIKSLNAHPIKRGESDLVAFKLMLKILDSGQKLVIFPEGIRTYNGKLSPLQNGAAMLALRKGVPIVPVKLEGTFNAWPRYKKFPKLFGKISCTFYPPIYPFELDKLPKSERAAALTKLLQDRLSE